MPLDSTGLDDTLIVGEVYLVPTVMGRFNGVMGWWPVLNANPNDAEFWVDGRFLTRGTIHHLQHTRRIMPHKPFGKSTSAHMERRRKTCRHNSTGLRKGEGLGLPAASNARGGGLRPIGQVLGEWILREAGIISE